MKDRKGHRDVWRKGTAVLQVEKTFWIGRRFSRLTTEFFDEFGAAQVISFAYKLNSIDALSKYDRKRICYFFK